MRLARSTRDRSKSGPCSMVEKEMGQIKTAQQHPKCRCHQPDNVLRGDRQRVQVRSKQYITTEQGVVRTAALLKAS